MFLPLNFGIVLDYFLGKLQEKSRLRMYSNLGKAPDTLGQIVMTGDAAIVNVSVY